MKFFLSFAFLVLSFLPAVSQQLVLSNYTYTLKSKIIGQLAWVDTNAASKNASIQKFALLSPQSGAFQITPKGVLQVRPSKLPAFGFSHSLVVQATLPNGQVRTDTFTLVRDEFRTNKVIAHRGAWKTRATSENSIAALQNAFALGCMGSEFDVRMSSDSVLFINHDPAINGLAIEQTPSSQLAQVQLTNGESLPTLEAYLREGMKQNHTRLIVEIKPSTVGLARSIALTHKVLQLVDQLKAHGWVEYISFEYGICKEIKRLQPFAKVSYLNGDKSPAQLAADKIDGLDYHFSVFEKNPDWIKQAKAEKQTINVWTVNDQARMEGLLQQDVDFITTNEPELLLKILATPNK